MPKVYMIHGWGGSPETDWFIWLRKQLEEKGVEVIIPEMPNTNHPKIDAWVDKLKEVVEADENTYLVGHSIGCQAIMRYLQELDKKIGGVIFVAGWFNLTDETWDEDYTKEIAGPWLDTPIDLEKVKANCNKIIAIFSDNDPYVPVSDSELFKEKLGAEIIILSNKGHISGEDGVKELPEAYDKLMEMM